MEWKSEAPRSEERGFPVKDIVIDPEYLDVFISPHSGFVHQVKPGHTVFAYVIGGKGCFCVVALFEPF